MTKQIALLLALVFAFTGQLNAADMTVRVDTTVTVPVNVYPLVDSADYTRETAVAYNASGMDLVWNFQTAAGVTTQTAVTPTTGGDYPWTHSGDGIYKIGIPASGGASINNDTEGTGWFSGIATGIAPWRGPLIQFSPSAVTNAVVDGSEYLRVDTRQFNGGNVTASSGRPEVNVFHVEGGDATDALSTAATASLNSYDPPTRAELTSDKNEIMASLRRTVWVDDNDGAGDLGTEAAPYDTLAAALSAAGDFSDIRFKPGTYTIGTDVTVTQAGLRIIGSSSAQVTWTTDGGALTSMMTPGPGMHIEGITIELASDGGAIFQVANAGYFSMKDVIINDTPDNALSFGNTNVRIDHCRINSGAYALTATNCWNVVVKDSVIFGGPVAMYLDANDAGDGRTRPIAKILNCTIAPTNTSNGTAQYAVWLLDRQHVIVDGCRIQPIYNATGSAEQACVYASGTVEYGGPSAAVITNSILVPSRLAGTGNNWDFKTSGDNDTVEGKIIAKNNIRFGLDNGDFIDDRDAVADETKEKTDNLPTDPADQSLLLAEHDDTQATLSSLSTAVDGTIAVSTTIATLTDQTHFTLTAGSADDDAYNTCRALIIDQSTPTQRTYVPVLDYVGSSKTITLGDTPKFTIAATDKIVLIDAGLDAASTTNLADAKDAAETAEAELEGAVDIEDALDEHGYTTVRAAKLDNADVPTSTRLAPTVSGRTADITVNGNIGIDWGNVDNPTTTINMSGTTVKNATDINSIVSSVTFGNSAIKTQLNTLQTQSESNATILAKVDAMAQVDGGDYRWDTNSLELSPTGVGGFESTDRDDLQAALAVLESVTYGNSALKTILDTKASQSSVDAVDNFIDTEIGTLQTSIDDVPTVSEFNARTVASGTYATSTALNTIDDLLDTEIGSILTGLADVPTVAEFEARSIVSANYATASALDAVDNYVDTEIGSLTTAVADIPTVAEFEARSIVSANYATASALDTVDNLLDTEITAILTGIDDIPTTTEFNARTLVSAGYATASALDAVDNYVDTEVSSLVASLTATAANVDTINTNTTPLATMISGNKFTTASLENSPAAGLTPSQVTTLNGISTRVLLGVPAAAPGGNGGSPTVNASNYIAGIAGTNNQLDDLTNLEVDLGPVEDALDAIKGAGFNEATDSLDEIRDRLEMTPPTGSSGGGSLEGKLADSSLINKKYVDIIQGEEKILTFIVQANGRFVNAEPTDITVKFTDSGKGSNKVIITKVNGQVTRITEEYDIQVFRVTLDPEDTEDLKTGNVTIDISFDNQKCRIEQAMRIR